MEEKQMKTLGGYEIVDEKARKDIGTISGKADEAYSLAKGATKAFVYDTYSDMISELNQLDKAELLVNYHIMIRTVCVPDLWISGVSDEHIEYAYTSNEDFIVDLTEDGVVQVGHFVLSALETQKVDLSEYVKKTDYATGSTAGIVKPVLGLTVGANGIVYIAQASESQIDAKTDGYFPITSQRLDYAVMKALSDSKLEWTDEEKAKALELLGGAKKMGATGYDGLYAFDTKGNQEYVYYSGKVQENAMAKRYTDGRLRVGTPVEDTDATTKKYVDDLFETIVNGNEVAY